MLDTAQKLVPRTTADLVFDKLHEEIATLKLLPRSKISEAEVANRMGVGRQPVRDAFNRLGNLDLLSIRPQRATVVRGFSFTKIQNARFIRLAVELEVMKSACSIWDSARSDALEENLAQQREANIAGQVDRFHALDYRFHQLICELGGHPLAFETITRCKHQVDRLCVLSLKKTDEVSAVMADHEEIAVALTEGSQEKAETITRTHLSRLDDAINEIHQKHVEYFE